jgi:beta-cyclopiazonate dehydrogenase
MNPFDLNDQEKSVFKKWKWFNDFAAIVSNTGLPDGLNIISTDAETSFNPPKLPFIINYYFTGFPGKYWTQVLGNQDLSADAAKKLITDDLIRIGTAGTLPMNRNPIIDAFTSHTL